MIISVKNYFRQNKQTQTGGVRRKLSVEHNVIILDATQSLNATYWGVPISIVYGYMHVNIPSPGWSYTLHDVEVT